MAQIPRVHSARIINRHSSIRWGTIVVKYLMLVNDAVPSHCDVSGGQETRKILNLASVPRSLAGSWRSGLSMVGCWCRQKADGGEHSPPAGRPPFPSYLNFWRAQRTQRSLDRRPTRSNTPIGIGISCVSFPTIPPHSIEWIDCRLPFPARVGTSSSSNGRFRSQNDASVISIDSP